VRKAARALTHRVALVDMQNFHTRRMLLTIVATLLGAWLSFSGLQLRILGGLLPLPVWLMPLGANPHAPLPEFAPASWKDLTALAWPMVVLGTSWAGALSGIWLGQRWGHRAAVLLAALCLPFFYLGSFLGLISLGLLIMPPLRTASDVQLSANEP